MAAAADAVGVVATSASTHSMVVHAGWAPSSTPAFVVGGGSATSASAAAAAAAAAAVAAVGTPAPAGGSSASPGMPVRRLPRTSVGGGLTPVPGGANLRALVTEDNAASVGGAASTTVHGRRVSVRVAGPSRPSDAGMSDKSGADGLADGTGEGGTLVIEEEVSACVFKPNGSFMKYWDTLMLVTLLFTGLITPFEVAFLPASETHDYGAPLFVINLVLEIMFFSDLAFHFFTPYFDAAANEYIQDHRAIALHYLRGMFVLDFATAMPWDIIVASNDGGTLRLIRFLRFVKLAKILRALRANRLVDRLKVRFGISTSTLSLSTFVILLLLEAHWMACVWHLTAILMPGGTQTWLDGLDAYSTTPFDRYTASLEWATQTITLVGGSPVVPVNPAERLVSIVCLLVAACTYAMIVGYTAGILTKVDTPSQDMAAERDDLNRYMADISLPSHLRMQAREFFDHCSKAYVQGVRASRTMAHLPLSLRREIADHLHGPWVRLIPWFCCPHEEEAADFVAALAGRLRPGAFGPLEMVTREGGVATTMYIVSKGLAISGAAVKLMSANAHFGEEVILTAGRYLTQTRSITFLFVYTLARDDLWAVLNSGDFDATRKLVRKAVIRMALRREFLAAVRASKAHRSYLMNLLGRTEDPDGTTAAAVPTAASAVATAAAAPSGGSGRRGGDGAAAGTTTARTVQAMRWVAASTSRAVGRLFRTTSRNIIDTRTRNGLRSHSSRMAMSASPPLPSDESSGVGLRAGTGSAAGVGFGAESKVATAATGGESGGGGGARGVSGAAGALGAPAAPPPSSLRTVSRRRAGGGGGTHLPSSREPNASSWSSIPPSARSAVAVGSTTNLLAGLADDTGDGAGVAGTSGDAGSPRTPSTPDIGAEAHALLPGQPARGSPPGLRGDGEEDTASASPPPPAPGGAASRGGGVGRVRSVRSAKKRFAPVLGALAAVDEVDEAALISPAQPVLKGGARYNALKGSGRRYSQSDATAAAAAAAAGRGPSSARSSASSRAPPPVTAVAAPGSDSSEAGGGTAAAHGNGYGLLGSRVPADGMIELTVSSPGHGGGAGTGAGVLATAGGAGALPTTPPPRTPARRASTGTVSIPRLSISGRLELGMGAGPSVATPPTGPAPPPPFGALPASVKLMKPLASPSAGVSDAGGGVGGAGGGGSSGTAAKAGGAPVVTLQQLDELDEMLNGMGLLARVFSRAKLAEKFDAETAAALSGVDTRAGSGRRRSEDGHSVRAEGGGSDHGAPAGAPAAAAASGRDKEVSPMMTTRRSHMVAALAGSLSARLVDSNTGRPVDTAALTARLGAPDAPPTIRAAGVAAAAAAAGAAAAAAAAALPVSSGSGRSSTSGAGGPPTGGRPPLSGASSPFRRPPMPPPRDPPALLVDHGEPPAASPLSVPHGAPAADVIALGERMTALEASMRQGNAATLQAVTDLLRTALQLSSSSDPAALTPRPTAAAPAGTGALVLAGRGSGTNGTAAALFHAPPDAAKVATSVVLRVDPPAGGQHRSSEGAASNPTGTPAAPLLSARSRPPQCCGTTHVRLGGHVWRVDTLALVIGACALQILTLAFAAAAYRASTR